MFSFLQKIQQFDCVIFHDVDLIPEDDRNVYSCPDFPRHMSVAVDKFNYQLPYQAIFGGVSALNNQHFNKVNGFSNLYFGWGGEDDDMAARLNSQGLKVIRYPIEIARYTMIKHNRESKNLPNPKRFGMLKRATTRMKYDGIRDVEDLYSVLGVDEFPTHTRISVLVDDMVYKLPFSYSTGLERFRDKIKERKRILQLRSQMNSDLKNKLTE